MASPKTHQQCSDLLSDLKCSEETRQKLREAWKRRKAKQACKKLTRLTEEMGLYEWQQERSGSQ